MKPKISLKALMIGFGLFFVFLLYSFPYSNFRGHIFKKIYEATGVYLVADEIYPSFFGWPGIGIKKVSVTMPMGSTSFDLGCEKLLFRVGLAGIFPPVPSVSMSLKRLKEGGDLYVNLGDGNPVKTADWEATDVSLGQLLEESSRIEGLLNSEGSLEYHTTDFSQSSGFANLNIEKLKTMSKLIEMSSSYSFLIPSLTLGSVKGKVAIKNGIAEISQLQFGESDSDVQGTISGNIRLGKTIEQSQLQIVVKMQIANRILQDPQSATFVSFLDSYRTSTPGDYAMKWVASISDFTAAGLSLRALPQKITTP